VSNPFSTFELQIQEQKNEVKELKDLIKRAADALEKESWPSLHHDYRELIAELRKAGPSESYPG
jgi:hypothetical protein